MCIKGELIFMNINNESIISKFSQKHISDDILIYEGKFCIYTNETIKCKGSIFYKTTEPISINFQAEIYKHEEYTNLDEIITYDEATIEVPGYKHMNIQILSVKNGRISGYIDDLVIRSKDSIVDYIQFDILNMDKIPGKLVEYNDLVYAGRIEFNINQYTVIIDKSYDYNKDVHKELVLKNGSKITHTGRIYKKDFSSFKTKNIDSIISRLAVALSFSCGRYINIINAFGFKTYNQIAKSNGHKLGSQAHNKNLCSYIDKNFVSKNDISNSSLNGCNIRANKENDRYDETCDKLGLNCNNVFEMNAIKEVNTYRAWYKMYSNDYKFVYKWTTTISNYHNFEKYLSLMCKKLENGYYNSTIQNIVDWYIEALNGHNLSNNIISIQTALEMLSYVVLVEDKKSINRSKFDLLPAYQNIRNFLQMCGIDISIPENIFTNKNIMDSFKDGVELITYYRNSVVHPSKKRKNFCLDFEEMWNITLLGIKYIELSLLYIINYKGEYTDRFSDFCFGDVDTVPWSKS